MYTLTHSLTRSLTHPPTYLITHSLTHSTFSLTHPVLTNLQAQLFTYLLTHSLTHLPTHSITQRSYSLTHYSLIYTLSYSLNLLSNQPSTSSFLSITLKCLPMFICVCLSFNIVSKLSAGQRNYQPVDEPLCFLGQELVCVFINQGCDRSSC